MIELLGQTEHVYYLYLALIGAFSGFARFAGTKKEWRLRTVLFSSIYSSLVVVASLALWYGEKIEENVWTGVAIAITFGYVQPEFNLLLQKITNGKG